VAGVARCTGLAAPLALTACSPIVRVAVLPTVDTRGNVGAEAKLTLALGLVTKFDHLGSPPHTNTGVLALPVEGGGGVRVHGPAQGVITAGTGFEYASVGSDVRDLGLRAALLASVRHYEPRPHTSPGTTLQGALLVTAWKGAPTHVLGIWGASVFALGPTLESALMIEDTSASGHFGLGLTLEWYRLTQWTVR
jgi:hypothetical protein